MLMIRYLRYNLYDTQSMNPVLGGQKTPACMMRPFGKKMSTNVYKKL